VEPGKIDATLAGEPARERRSEDTVSVIARHPGHGQVS
jgi:hypothetical protein